MKTVNVVWKFKRQHNLRPMKYSVQYSDKFAGHNNLQIYRITTAI